MLLIAVVTDDHFKVTVREEREQVRFILRQFNHEVVVLFGEDEV
jgi:hypothetical protein